MMYDERMVQPMREELTRLGVEEARTAEAVDAVLGEKKGTVLVVVNSVCGCAAGNARPAVQMALEHGVKPERMITVFAGNDKDATQRAREYLVGYRPSSPSIALFRDGEVVKMLERWQIEGRTPWDIAAELTAAFDQYCSKEAVAG
jgi:putative YphP/YqiW family bacilliredoxin